MTAPHPDLSRPLLAVTQGDPNGIGPEVVLRALADPGLHERARCVVIGHPDVLRVHAEAAGLDTAIQSVSDLNALVPSGTVAVFAPEGLSGVVTMGAITDEGGAASMGAVEAATDAALDGRAAAVVTAPISKEAIFRAGYRVPGHTEFLAERTHAEGYAMVLASGTLRVALVTTHVPVRAVADLVTPEAIGGKLAILKRALQSDLGIDTPRIAVLGLNPHAGDGGVIGTEEIDVVAPALERARAAGIEASGPFPADAFFGRRAYRDYDAVLAMYHDQGLAPFKALAMGAGINWTAGLPIVRTSPDHGTGFDIAGQGRAVPDSMRQALYLAAEIAARRVRP